MRKITVFLLLLYAGGLSLNCAGTRSEGNSFGKFEYVEEIGVATDFDTADKTRRILSRLNFVLVREERSTNEFYFETQWKDRHPFEDEREAGVVAARTRIIIRTRPKTATGFGGAKLNRIRLFAENEVQYASSHEWRRAVITPMLKDYLDDIVERIKIEFRSGMRKF